MKGITQFLGAKLRGNPHNSISIELLLLWQTMDVLKRLWYIVHFFHPMPIQVRTSFSSERNLIFMMEFGTILLILFVIKYAQDQCSERDVVNHLQSITLRAGGIRQQTCPSSRVAPICTACTAHSPFGGRAHNAARSRPPGPLRPACW